MKHVNVHSITLVMPDAPCVPLYPLDFGSLMVVQYSVVNIGEQRAASSILHACVSLDLIIPHSATVCVAFCLCQMISLE